MSESEGDSDSMSHIETHIGNIEISPTTEILNAGDRLNFGSAEIDGDASEVLTDVPTLPDSNILTLLSQVPELPEALRSGNNASIQFEGIFITVEEEYLNEQKSDHVKHLLEQYQKNDNGELKLIKGKGKKKNNHDGEEYEKAVPLHGNQLFHSFLTRIQKNPSQILRYARDGSPLPMSPLPNTLDCIKCSHCGGRMCFELQILPTIIPSLRISDSTAAHLEFGTVFIYACQKSCWNENDKMLSEYVIVQSEPV